MFKGQCIKLIRLRDELAELCFDRINSDINKFDALTLNELDQAIDAIEKNRSLKGLLISSAKKVFIVGADITEFGELFQSEEKSIAAHMMRTQHAFNRIEDLPIPSVVAINGFALGGGLELALTASYRVMAEQAKIGLPEVHLGLIPGYGGTVRLSRMAGPAIAIDWIGSGKQISADTAQATGVADQISPLSHLRQMAIDLLSAAVDGEINWRIRQERKRHALSLPSEVIDSIFEPAILKAKAKTSQHQPATLLGLGMMQKACQESRDTALELEAIAFATVSQTQAAHALIQTFLSEQALKKQARVHVSPSNLIRTVAILGAGSMGTGLAALIASSNIRVIVIDNNPRQLDKCMHAIHRHLQKRVEKGDISAEKSIQIQNLITTQSHYQEIDQAEVVIEAVTEDLENKQKLLRLIEGQIPSSTLLATNTSSLKIADIGASLSQPEKLVGMHFFNPVPTMPLVEVIQGENSSPEVVGKAMGFAIQIGKLPILIRDSSGFMVNRIFTAYMRAFEDLVSEGANFVQIDKVMENFGWPLGPAALLDMLGIDICCNASQFISEAHPQQMAYSQDSVLQLLVKHQRLGQKNGVGFYHYSDHADGKSARQFKEEALSFLAQRQSGKKLHYEDSHIIDRLMLPLMLEACRALEEKVASSPAEVDIALLYGAGVPAYLGGPLKLIDWWGAKEVVERSTKLASLGPMYTVPDSLQKMAQAGQTFYKP